MGARQSKRSVDITTTPKKGDGDSPIIEGEGKVKEIGDVDAKVTTNGTLHTEVESTVSLRRHLSPLHPPFAFGISLNIQFQLSSLSYTFL